MSLAIQKDVDFFVATGDHPPGTCKEARSTSIF